MIRRRGLRQRRMTDYMRLMYEIGRIRLMIGRRRVAVHHLPRRLLNRLTVPRISRYAAEIRTIR